MSYLLTLTCLWTDAFGLLLHEVMHGAMVFGELTPTEAFFAAAEGRRPLIDLGGLPDEYQRLDRLIE
eukprot:1511772-Prymnesium_polylepis.1